MRTSNSRRSAPNAKILIVDDNRLGLAARKVVLEEIGYTIAALSCAQEALEEFANNKFDLVVTDYKMPGMNGVEFISRLRSTAPEIPVILISGFADTLGLNEASTGADVVIQKSNHEVTNLIRAVDRLLTKKPAAKKPPSSQSATRAKRKTV